MSKKKPRRSPANRREHRRVAPCELIIQPAFVTAHSVTGTTSEPLIMFTAPILDFDGQESTYQAVVDAAADVPAGHGPYRLSFTFNRSGEFKGVLALRLLDAHPINEAEPIHQPTQPIQAGHYGMDH